MTISVGIDRNNSLLARAHLKMRVYCRLNGVNAPNSPKQISPTKIKFQRMLLSTPSGRQYSANKNTIAKAEIPMFNRLERFSVIPVL